MQIRYTMMYGSLRMRSTGLPAGPSPDSAPYLFATGNPTVSGDLLKKPVQRHDHISCLAEEEVVDQTAETAQIGETGRAEHSAGPGAVMPQQPGRGQPKQAAEDQRANAEKREGHETRVTDGHSPESAQCDDRAQPEQGDPLGPPQKPPQPFRMPDPPRVAPLRRSWPNTSPATIRPMEKT